MTQYNDNEIKSMADAYVHGLLYGDQSQFVEQQVETNAKWRKAVDDARARQSAMNQVPNSEPSEQLIQKTLNAVAERDTLWHRHSRRAFRIGVPVAFAAAVLLLASLHIHYATLEPSPFDLQVYGQNRLLAGTDASIRIRLINHLTGKPVGDVPVNIELISDKQETITVASFDTDDRGTGTPILNLPDWNPGSYSLRVTAQTEDGPEIFTRDIELARSWKLMLSSDKPVYQPGQTIQLRSLSLRRPDLKPVAGQDVTFSIADPRGNVIFKRNDVTSDFGIASAKCALANEIIEGPYTVTCQVGDTESKVNVDVMKYVLPKFKIGVTLDKPYYKPGETMKGEISARYFFGKPVVDGSVTVDVAAVRFDATTIQVPELKTDADGKAKFELRLPRNRIERFSGLSDGRVKVKVNITDSAGQKESRSIDRVVTLVPLRLEVIPESSSLVPGIANRIYVYVSYVDGRPAAKTRVLVSGLSEAIETNDLGVASFEMTPKTNNLEMVVRATDANGVEARRDVQLSTAAGGGDFLVRTDKATYTGGETVNLVALGGGVEPVFVDLIKNNQTIVTQVVEMAAGRGEFAFDLPPGLNGTIQVVAYRFSNRSGLATRKSRVIYVRSSGEVKLTAKLDMDEYRPGKKAKLALTLTDKDGNPAPGAVSLAAVDEAVYSVMAQRTARPGMEQTFFMLEQELLQPVYAIYNWSPGIGGQFDPVDVQMLEQALFSRTEFISTVGQNDASTTDYVDADAFSEPDIIDDFDRVVEEHAIEAPRAPREFHTLTGATYITKVPYVSQTRENGLDNVAVGWTTLLMVSLLSGYIKLCFSKPKTGLIVGLVTLCVVPFLLVMTLVTFMVASEGRDNMMPMAMMDQFDADGVKFDEPLITEKTASEPGSLDVVPDSKSTPRVRVRRWFPETLLWRPELITDDNGRVSIEIDLADSITTWRLSASAVTAQGKLGATEQPIRVFQPFFADLNLPVALTRNDEVGVPVVVYNYLDKPQTVKLELARGQWFESTGDSLSRDIELKAGEVKSTNFPIRVLDVGNYKLMVNATGAGVADAVEREIEVVPDGTRIAEVHSGSLQDSAAFELTVSDTAIVGSNRTILKLYPSTFSQVVEGLDAIFQRPYGCFEQTSSTTYPNVLALEYLRRIKKSAPTVEAKARQYIHLGYQRLVGFEVNGGGFDWYGNPPANRSLTAYGLMEFEDMAAVHDVDPRLIDRTRQWLLSQRKPDGSWPAEDHMVNNGQASNGPGTPTVRSTAYIAWSVFSGSTNADREPTWRYLTRVNANQVNDPYLLALISNALLAMKPQDTAVLPYLERLESMKKQTPDGKQVWWDQSTGQQTTFYGGGQSANVETTAMTVLAYIKSNRNPASTRGALQWLTSAKDERGTWHSTQATILALKALIAGTDAKLGQDKGRNIEVVVDGQVVKEITITKDQFDVMKQIDLTPQISQSHQLSITDRSGSGTGFQLTHRYHVPGENRVAAAVEPLDIKLAYDRQEMRVGELIKVRATVTNQMTQLAPMVMLDLPIPGGFSVARGDFDAMVENGSIAKYQITPRSVIVYLRQLRPGNPLQLDYRLQANMPVKVKVAPAKVYEYYNPDKRGRSEEIQLLVS